MAPSIDVALAYDDQKIKSLSDDLPTMRSLVLEGRAVTKETFKLLADKCEDLSELHLIGTDLDDDGIELIGKIRTLDWLYLDCVQVTNRGARHLKNLPKLQGLHMINTAVTDEGLTVLPDLPDLVYLENVTSKEIGDKGLSSMTHIPALEYLRLSAVKTNEDRFSRLIFGDALLKFTFEMPAVTDEAMKALSERHPRCFLGRYRYSRHGDQSIYVATTKVEVFRNKLITNFQQPDPEAKPTNPLTQAEVEYLVSQGLLPASFMKNAGMIFKNQPAARVITDLSPDGQRPQIYKPDDMLRTLLSNLQRNEDTDEKEREERPWSW